MLLPLLFASTMSISCTDYLLPCIVRIQHLTAMQTVAVIPIAVVMKVGHCSSRQISQLNEQLMRPRAMPQRRVRGPQATTPEDPVVCSGAGQRLILGPRHRQIKVPSQRAQLQR